MRLRILLIAVTAVLVLGACASNAPPEPRYEPEPYVDREPSSAPTMSLHDRVHDALEREMGSAASEIGVRVEGSKVYLTGSVRSQEDRGRAHEIAHAVSGVTSVYHDGLQVR